MPSRGAQDSRELLGRGVDEATERGLHRLAACWSWTECSIALTRPRLDLGVADITFAASEMVRRRRQNTISFGR